ncbi:cyclic GMP-AMP synthase [Trichonephila inaurata madagascariensis]|uniref:Cyclic GMP-AMP synthase n=1 Tax=Trichonephila inaurata madagascariensis TaxID=2747483 RepID=A0A8X6IYD8_9ARAC|nr:cyclic GMP-AMP synthase [Trichonephila inaurata madagascariensis]
MIRGLFFQFMFINMNSCNYAEVLQFVFSKGKLKLEVQLDGIYSLKKKTKEFKQFCISKSEAFKNLFQGYYYTGSYFEGLRVSEATEFDVNTVFSIPSDLEYWVNELEAPLSYATIKLKQPLMFNDKTRLFFDEENYLVGNRLRSWFRSLVESFMYYTELTYPGLLQVKISHSGPACTLKVLYNMVWISIDLVPVFSLDAIHLQKYTLKNIINVSKESLLNCVLVPKPLKMELSSLLTSDLVERAWRIHFPETEKEILKDKHALKPIIKLMKDLRDKEMWPVPSYFIKVVAFWLVKENPHQHFWRDARLGLLFLKFLKAMEKHLEAKHLGHILYPKFNLFHSLSPRTLKNMQIRIHHIIVNLEKHPIIAYKLFKVPILDHHLL